MLSWDFIVHLLFFSFLFLLCSVMDLEAQRPWPLGTDGGVVNNRMSSRDQSDSTPRECGRDHCLLS